GLGGGGGARWGGRIYGETVGDLSSGGGRVFHGPLGMGLFQGLYQAGGGWVVEWLSGVLWVVLVLLGLVLGEWKWAGAWLVMALVAAWARMRRQPVRPFALSPQQLGWLWGLCLVQPVVREWARLRGMVAYRARPGGGADVAEPSALPRPPRKATLRCGERAYWSTAGKDRHLLLEALAAQVGAWRWDDGWRRFDGEVSPEAWISPAVLTVTEYHGGGRCLTRVRLLLRVRWWVFLGLGLALGWATGGGVMAVVVALGVIVSVVAVALRRRGRLEVALDAAARQVGLVRPE
ncbi:MAG: hypothetical protein KDK99_19155, partial [Verrucomicrobiales bacterium]|nr:hypothetical protein [Verrucomicrobiales bacterium]